MACLRDLIKEVGGEENKVLKMQLDGKVDEEITPLAGEFCSNGALDNLCQVIIVLEVDISL